MPSKPEKHYVTVKAAIWKGGKLLLQKEERKNGKIVYDLPGGRIDIGESLHEGLRREVLEEIGVEIEAISDLPVKIWSKESGGDGVVAMIFEIKLKSEDFNYNFVSDTSEVIEAQYMSKQDYLDKPDFIHKQAILEYFDQYLKS